MSEAKEKAAAAAAAGGFSAPEGYTGERLAADDVRFAPDMARHLAAYHLVGPMVVGKEVLEAGCGEGYGASMMAEHAARVVGIDYNGVALGIAREKHSRPNVEFREVNLLELAETAPGTFDAVTNFQVLEHLDDPAPFLAAAAACLKPGGCLILTTPNRLASVSENPYHVHEYVADELRDTLAPFFDKVEVKGVIGNDAVYAFERARGAQAQKLLRLDPLGVRNLLPEAVVKFLFARLALLVRSRVAAQGVELVDLSMSDFGIGESEPPQWIDLLAIAWRKPEDA
ncbi:MAG: methyltransferase domain-containing protein [bacterium]